jgi:catechol-2,3-dioxygenase
MQTRRRRPLSSGREPLDVEALLGHLMKEDQLDAPVPSETRIGHMHLHVGDLDEAVGFYHGVLGFDLQGAARAFRMAFVSAGGYHHHIGLNTWQGEGAPPAPADALGMRHCVARMDGAERSVWGDTTLSSRRMAACWCAIHRRMGCWRR